MTAGDPAGQGVREAVLALPAPEAREAVAASVRVRVIPTEEDA